MRIAVYGRAQSDNLPSTISSLIKILKDKNCNIYLNRFLHTILSDKGILNNINYNIFDDDEKLKGKVDLLLSLGGDGTLLDTIALIEDSGIPVLGINMGRLGFISSVPVDMMEKAINDILDMKYTIYSRTLLQVSSVKSGTGELNLAINEMAIQKKDSSSMITIHTYVNGEFLNSYWADGLIVATPTGSTAYSLSCGGPILTPDSHNLVITPIAPHNLAVRPVVITDESIITMKISGRSAGYWISLDSRYHPGEPGDEITVQKADFKMNFIEIENNNFFMALRNKLLWGRDIRN